jgi:hypothetical protein
MLLQTVLHNYKIVNIVIKVVSPEISKLEHVVPSIRVQEDLFSNRDQRSAPDTVIVNTQQYLAES